MKVNGKIHSIASPITIIDFLTQQNYPAHKVAVELNGSIISKTKFDSTTLKDSDEVEIVCFVGGG